MGENKDVETWSEAVIARIKVIPDHHLENFEELSDDSLRLFRISLVVLSVYGSVFGFIFNSGSQAVVNVLTHPTIAFSLLVFLVAIGGFMIAYRYSRYYCTNGIKATDYADLHEEYLTGTNQDTEKDKLIYEHYWKHSPKYNQTTKHIQRIIYISGFSLYVAVIYAPIGLFSFYITFPPWFISMIVAGPMVIPIAFSKLAGLFGERGGIVLKPEEELDQEPE